MPILATQASHVAPVIVTFDQPLVAGVSAGSNWTGAGKNGAQPRRFVAALGNPIIVGATVTVIPKYTAITGVSPWVGFRATPPDLVSAATGVPVAPFLDFPIT